MLVVNVWPPAVVNVLLSGRRRLMIELSMANTPDGPRPTAVPLIVTAGPPADMVVPAMGNAEGFAVKIWSPTVNS